MDTQLLRRAFSVDEFHRMAEADVFGEDDRLELLDGEIVRMTPSGSQHAGCVNRLTSLLTAAVGTDARSAFAATRQRAQFEDIVGTSMPNEFTAVFERDGEWHIAYCPEIPGANGQGRTKEEARQSLSEAIALVLSDRREEGLKGVPVDAERETVTVE